MPYVPVTDPADPRLDDYRRLTDPEARVAYERRAGVFVVEGRLAVEQLLASAYETRSLLLTPDQAATLDAGDHPAYVADRAVLIAVAGFDLHRGVLAVANRPADRNAEEMLAAPGVTTVLALERLNDYDNVGGLFRVARALGADAVLLDGETCDPLYRRAVRVSVGHVLHVPYARTPEPLEALRRNGFRTYALTPAATATALADVRREGRAALLLGAEGPGLKATTMEGADVRVRIPLHPGVDSLNVVTAAAVALAALVPSP